MNRFALAILIATLTGAGCAAPAATSTALDLSNRGLKKVSMDVFDMTGLVELDLSGNELEGALPSELGRLVNLKILDASHNKMTGVPAEIGRLTSLETLDLSDNQLTGLPMELGNLKQLKVLDLSGNPYSEQDLAKIEKELTNTEIKKR
jgi:Leucine-rich repeat (LRR) protein